MDINDLTFGEIKSIAAMFNAPTTYAVKPGDKVFIRTVTHAFTGLVGSVTEKEIVLTSAAWIADTGRFAQAIESGVFDEVEPFPAEMRVVVNHESVIDKMVVTWELPKEQK